MRQRLATILMIATLGGCGVLASGQRPVQAVSAPTPARSDAAAIEATLNAVYAAISGPVGQARDFARMRSLFTGDARLTAITLAGLRGGTLDDYIAHSGTFLVEQGLTESALANRIEIFGDLAHAWSSYEGRFTNTDGSAGAVRGINSFQLVRQDDGRWLVQSILWHAETPANPLPTDMANAR